MYGRTKYKDFYYYGCKHRTMTRGHKCDYKKQIREELLDDAVAEVIVKLVGNPKFAAMMQEKIKRKADLDYWFYRMYDKIQNVETQLIEARAKKQAVEAEKLTGDNIYKVLIYFEKLYAVMNEVERR